MLIKRDRTKKKWARQSMRAGFLVTKYGSRRRCAVPRSGHDFKLTRCGLKLWNNFHAPEDVEPALDQSLGKLGVDYLDLYLIHWYDFVITALR